MPRCPTTRWTLVLIVIVTLGGRLAMADEAAATATAADTNATATATAEATPTAQAVLTNAPAAVVAADPLDQLRDPFWPIGWTPPPVDATATAANNDAARPKGPIRWEEATKRLSLRGLTELPNGKFVASIAGVGVVEEGDRITLEFEGLNYHWRVQSISRAGIVPKRLGVSARK